MKYFDTFTGIGGFTLGIESMIPESECVGYSEIDKYASQIYAKHYSNHKNYGDITKINTTDLPDFDLLVGGFPCQAFSVAGKRQGFDDTRGTLFFELARILKDKRPRHFIFENVKGLLSHDGGKTFSTILEVLTDLGYEYQWQVLNSKDFGVPQNRERVYIVGHLRGERRPEVFPITGSNTATLKEYTRGQSQGNRIYSTGGVSTTLASQAGGLGAKTGLYMINDPSRDKPLTEKLVFPTIRVQTHGNLPSFIDRSTKEAKTTNTARTIQARYHKGYSQRTAETSGVITNHKIRRLTPIECERLQAFPDNWTAGISDTQRYKCCGNAITVSVVQEIIDRLYGQTK